MIGEEVLKEKVILLEGRYTGKSILIKNEDKIYVTEHKHYPNLYSVFINENGTGWICNVRKTDVKLIS